MVTAAGVSDRDSVQEVSLRETFYINYNYELFKSFIVDVYKRQVVMKI